MILKTTIISSFASFILGGSTFERIKAVVMRVEEKDLTGEQKRKAVIKEIQTIGLSVATWALNLAIELAVAWLKTKADGPKKP